jgi:hypothetical protein
MIDDLPDIPTAYVIRGYVNDQGTFDGVARGLAAGMAFDVRVSWGGRSRDYLMVGFENDVPDSTGDEAYPIVVKPGTKCGIVRVGKGIGFVIPWKPVVKRCPTAAGRGGASGPGRRPDGSTGGASDTGGGGPPLGGGGTTPGGGGTPGSVGVPR